MFDVSGFPSVPAVESLTVFEGHPGDDEDEAAKISTAAPTSAVDVEEQLRAAMSKLAYCGSSLGELPVGCSFTVCIELKVEGEPPLGVSKNRQSHPFLL